MSLARPTNGRARLLTGLGAVAGAAAVAPVLAARDTRGRDPGALDPPVPPVGAVHAVRRPDGAVLHTVVSGVVHGGGPTFVLTHGLACDHRLWAYQARMLGALGRVVAWDLRGHGASSIGPASPRRALRPDVLAADLDAVVEATASGPVFLVGHSLGGLATLLALREHRRLRERTAGAVLVATPTADIARIACEAAGGTVAERAALRVLLGWLVGDGAVQRLVLDPARGGSRGYAALRIGGFGSRPSPAHVAAIREQIAATPPSVRRAAFAGLCGVDLRGSLGGLTTPALVVAGGRDRLVDPAMCLALADELPNARAVVFERAGHAVVLERHASITRRIALLVEETLAGSMNLDRVATAPY